MVVVEAGGEGVGDLVEHLGTEGEGFGDHQCHPPVTDFQGHLQDHDQCQG